MSEFIRQKTIEISIDPTHNDIIGQVRTVVERQIGTSETPIRFAVTKSDGSRWTCELGTLTSGISGPSIFHFNPRSYENQDSFNVIMLVPTGIGATVGGHAGDATTAATLLSSVCDTLITHPNVLNASDIIQIPANTLYVEGSMITQLMMGAVGLDRIRSNRLLVSSFRHMKMSCLRTPAMQLALDAARASYGLSASIAEIDPRFRMISEYTPSGVAAGRIDGH